MTPRRFTLDEWMADTGLTPPPGVRSHRKGDPPDSVETVPPTSAPCARTGKPIVVVSIDDPDFVERTETWVACLHYEPADVGYASVTRTPRERVEAEGTRWILLATQGRWVFYAKLSITKT